jgi:hypothetical protein
MTAIHWTNGIDGSFEDASKWNTATVPGSQDDAFIDATGTYILQTSAPSYETVHGLSIAVGATLDINNNPGFVLASLGTDNNDGTIEVHSYLEAHGTISNTGLIQAAGGFSYLRCSGNNTNSGIIEAVSAGTINFQINSDAGRSTWTNFGTVEADGGEVDILFAPSFIDNQFTNFGTIEVLGQGSVIVIAGYAVAGITIAHPITNSGSLIVDGGTMYVDDAISGSGTAVISNGGDLIIRHAGFAENTSFSPGANGTLEIAIGSYADPDSPNGASFTGTLSGFTNGDRIELRGLRFLPVRRLHTPRLRPAEHLLLLMALTVRQSIWQDHMSPAASK